MEIMQENFIGLLALTAVLTAYTFIVVRSNNIARPIREELFKTADRLRSYPQMNGAEHILDRFLDRSVSPFEAFRLALVVVPRIAVTIVVDSIRHRNPTNFDFGWPKNVENDFFAFARLTFISACLANPIIGIVILFEIFILALLFIRPAQILSVYLKEKASHNGFAY